jgi:hypothetical protein
MQYPPKEYKNYIYNFNCISYIINKTINILTTTSKRIITIKLSDWGKGKTFKQIKKENKNG